MTPLLVERWLDFLRQVVAAPDTPIGAVDILADGERAALARLGGQCRDARFVAFRLCLPLPLSRCVGRVGLSPRRSRLRTSCAVPREIPAALAISRKKASGLSDINLLAILRPSVGLSVRIRRSQPTLLFD